MLFHMESGSTTEEPELVPVVLWSGSSKHYARIPMVQRLRELAYEGKIDLQDVPPFGLTRDAMVENFHDLAPAAFICRPTTWPEYAPSVEDFPEKCLLVNLGVGTDHLEEFHEKVPDWLVLVDKNGPAAKLSARHVAQHIAVLAVCLLRRIPLAATLAGGESQYFHNQYKSLIRSGSLIGKHWVCLAGGKQVRELLPLLKALGVAKVTIWDRESNAAKFARRFCTDTELVNTSGLQPETGTASGHTARLVLGDFIVEATNDYTKPARNADFISIHAGSLKQRAEGEAIVSPFPLGDYFFSLLKPSVCIMNTARGSMVDEYAAVKALREGLIAAYATDVLYPDVEKSRQPEPRTDEDGNLRQGSPLWRYYLELCGDRDIPSVNGPNLLILPHIAGSVEELFSALLDELIPELLRRLKIASPSEPAPSPPQTF